LLGIEFALTGALHIKPVAPIAFWEKGFGQTLSWRDANFSYTMDRDGIKGNYTGSFTQTVIVRLQKPAKGKKFQATVNGKSVPVKTVGEDIQIVLPQTQKSTPVSFEIKEA
jgi:hypothetical protein